MARLGLRASAVHRRISDSSSSFAPSGDESDAGAALRSPLIASVGGVSDSASMENAVIWPTSEFVFARRD